MEKPLGRVSSLVNIRKDWVLRLWANQIIIADIDDQSKHFPRYFVLNILFIWVKQRNRRKRKEKEKK